MRLLIVLSVLLIPSSLAQNSEDSSELEFGGPRPSSDGPPLFPKFLMQVPQFARKEFFDIVSSDQFSTDQQNQQLTIWAKAFNVTDEFNEWTKQVQKQKDAVTQNVQAVVANISTVYNQLEEILSNTNLTRRDQHDQIRKLSVTFPREVRALFFIARNYRPESKTPVFGQATKPQTPMVPFGVQQSMQNMMYGSPMMFAQQQQRPFMYRMMGGSQEQGMGQQGGQNGPMNDFTKRGSQRSQSNDQGAQGPDFGPEGQGEQGGRGQGPDFGPGGQDDFPGRRGPGGPGSRGPGGPGSRGPGGQGGRGQGGQGGRGQGPDFGPGGQGGRGQGPDFGPGGQDDFPGRRGPGGPGGRGQGGQGGRGQGPDFGPGGQGGRGQGPDFGPGGQDDFPGRRGPGGPGGRGQEGSGGRGQGSDFGPFGQMNNESQSPSQQGGRQFNDNTSSYQKFFERQSNSGTRFDQSSGFGMRGGNQRQPNQNFDFANN
ncbi:unnamed protein product [Caenorhabditis sp. 36 PRJEB53466]|nr:unnamed protein product [Caenorhabditis sp. 36 PRJEB53466]